MIYTLPKLPHDKLTLDDEDLVAHGKTGQEIADYIGADEVIFLDLDGKDGLKAACMEAADSTSKVQDFEVGVFCGKYVTEVPEGYLEHLSDIRVGKPRQKNAVTNIKPGGDEQGAVIASSGPTNQSLEGNDIRYVVADTETSLRLLINVSTVFTTIASEPRVRVDQSKVLDVWWHISRITHNQARRRLGFAWALSI